MKKWNGLNFHGLPPSVWPLRLAGVPEEEEPAPNVRPGLWNDAPGAVTLASLTAFSTAEVKAGGFAPWIVSITEPFLKMRKVGMARTPWACAMDCWLSTLTLQKAILPGLEYLVESDSKMGAIILQGPHQSA